MNTKLLICSAIVALSTFGGLVAYGQERGKPGLSNYYQIWRTPNAYEGVYKCQTVCFTSTKDAGRYPEFVRVENVAGADACIAKLIEKGNKECPRGL